MSAVEWDFSKFPPDEHERIIALFNAGKWVEIVKLHDKYGVSDNSYCCSNTMVGVKNWVKHGIKTGKIKSAAETKAS